MFDWLIGPKTRPAGSKAVTSHLRSRPQLHRQMEIRHGIELAACEKTVLALEQTSRIVPTTRTRITASMTAYSAMSWPLSSTQNLTRSVDTVTSFSNQGCADGVAQRLIKGSGKHSSAPRIVQSSKLMRSPACHSGHKCRMPRRRCSESGEG